MLVDVTPDSIQSYPRAYVTTLCHCLGQYRSMTDTLLQLDEY